jgi:hypothetical protein
MNNQGEAHGEMMVLNQGDQKIRKKLANFFKKYPPKVAKSKKAKISTTKLNLKAQSIHNNPVLKP